MTALSDLLNDAKGDDSIDSLLDRASRDGIEVNRTARSLIYKALNGDHAKNPREETLQLWAAIFRLDVRKLREAAGKPAGELGDWKPVPESARLSQEQRNALDALIRTIVQGGGARERAAPKKRPDPSPGKLPMFLIDNEAAAREEDTENPKLGDD